MKLITLQKEYLLGVKGLEKTNRASIVGAKFVNDCLTNCYVSRQISAGNVLLMVSELCFLCT